jgi:pimeloyl-ACP methyl ester carboxylesterase
MKTHVRFRTASAGLTALSLAIPVGLLTSPQVDAATASDKTNAVESRRVDKVTISKIGWYSCFHLGECATVKLPLDYDQPRGATVEIALGRVRAAKPSKRIGTLFVNPGGPGGSGVEMALLAENFLGSDILDRFDIVGFDPRGIGFSDNVKCFKDNATQAPVLNTMSENAFPFTASEEKTFVAASQKLGKACSTSGKSLAGAMSTAEAARDMDVLRRALGDKKLTYLGFSYGTYLGEVYASLFPDRVRALTIDGVIDPVGWAGCSSTASSVLDDRIKSADGAWKALKEILARCDKVGGKKCVFADGNPTANLTTLADRLKKKPLTIEDSDFGDTTYTYSTLVGDLLSLLYDPDAGDEIADYLSHLYLLSEPPATSRAAARTKAARSLTTLHRRALATRTPKTSTARFGFPYDNSLEAYSGVLCTDGRHPQDAATWPKSSAAADKRAPYFGRAWSWSSSQCAEKTWTVKDEDTYTGPFTRRTSAPLLVVGSYWDPATNYQGAVRAASLFPNSRLLSSDNWGHTAYGTSECVDGAVNTYLLTGKVPAAGKTCRGDVQPFTTSISAASTKSTTTSHGKRPPIMPLLPSALSVGMAATSK